MAMRRRDERITLIGQGKFLPELLAVNLLNDYCNGY